VDISDPLLPVEVGFLSATGEVTAVDVNNDLVAIGDDGLRMIDVVNPATPVEIGYYQQDGVTDVAASGDYAYLVHGGLTIVDVSDPSNPVFAGEYLPGWESPISHVAVRDNHAFLAWHGCIYSEQCTAGFSVLDVSNPAAPVPQDGTGYVSRYTHGLFLSGDYAYVAADVAGLQIIDLDTPYGPLPVGSYNEFWNMGGLSAMSNHYLFVGMGFQVWWYDYRSAYKIVDVGDPHLPVERTLIEGSGVHLADDRYAYVHGSDRHTSSLYALDITDPANPVGTGSWYTHQGFASNILFGDTYVYANGDSQTVALDKSSLAQIASHEQIEVVYNQNGYMYAKQGGDLHVYTPPFTEVNVVEDLTINSLQVTGRYGYALYEGLLILDMINPVEPVVVGSFELPDSNIWSVIISGDYAYLPTSDYGLVIVDISNPAAPMQVASYPTGYYPNFQLIGSYLYIADGGNGIVMLDVSNPAAPVQVASYPKPYPGNIVVNGTHLYASYGAEGIYAFKLYGIDRRFYLPFVMERAAAVLP
jgi:hypothetical protein